MYQDLANKEQELQKQMIKLSEENIELRFEVEQAHKDMPRLKVRTLIIPFVFVYSISTKRDTHETARQLTVFNRWLDVNTFLGSTHP